MSELAEEPGAPEAEAEAPAADDPWSGPSQEDWGQVQEYVNQSAPVIDQLGQILSQPYEEEIPPGFEGGPQVEEEQAEFNPFDPESVTGLINQNVTQAIQEALGPFQGLLGMMASEKGEELAKNELNTIKEEIGEFDEDTSFLISSGLIEQGADPSQALRAAGTHMRDFEQKTRADERQKVIAEMQGLSTAPGETTGGAEGTREAEAVPTGPNRYEEAVQRALSRRRPIMPGSQ